MDNINSQVIELMRLAGVPESIIAAYIADIPEHIDSLDTVGLYWAKQVALINVNIRTHLDICMYLRDTKCTVLWLEKFRIDVIPMIAQYGMFSKGGN